MIVKKYVLCPGFVRSITDNDMHRIGPEQLARLYGVPMEMCEVYDPDMSRSRHEAEYKYRKTRHLIHLHPRENGDYSLPTGEQHE